MDGVIIRPVEEEDGDRGAIATFPYDRALVERFRAAFPQARWRNDERAWFVPGVRAAQRLARWFAGEVEAGEAHVDDRGRDAFAFDPIDSPYLEPAEDLRIRTPYSRTVVEQLREVPWAYWDEDMRVWRVPFRSYDELRRRWPTIEAAARRNEPAERQRRRREAEGAVRQPQAARLAAERRRRRYPVAADALPPPNQPVMTAGYGIVVFVDTAGEIVDPAVAAAFYPHADRDDLDFVWADWRVPSLAELIAAWPARHPPGEPERARGWWQPGRDDLRQARRTARARERAAARRMGGAEERPTDPA
ncbi:hypothetical protein [Labrys wisconsinensis]|uniref:HARP domain-containing protein n=1 Tax=Labrys wisconsinensis TaxID=425677 RepID=A0ABU0J8X5_9HYPH|nr:hypothetical protein [Labrys wisconsinensis]MDQ0470719.1 hypothetical protein [Labrys wisconsinensis]